MLNSTCGDSMCLFMEYVREPSRGFSTLFTFKADKRIKLLKFELFTCTLLVRTNSISVWYLHKSILEHFLKRVMFSIQSDYIAYIKARLISIRLIKKFIKISKEILTIYYLKYYLKN